MLGIGSLALMLAFNTSIWGSSDYKNVASMDTVLRSASEEATAQIQQEEVQAGGWSCATGAPALATNEGVTFSLPTGYTAQIPLSTVEYWNGTSFAPECLTNAPQLALITVTSGTTSSSISVVIDDPAAPPVPTCSTGPATKLVFISQPGNSTVVSSLSPPPVVAVECANNQVDTSDLSQVNLAITAGSGTSGATLSSNCTPVDDFGVVTFSNCAITTLGNNYTLTATDASLPAPGNSVISTAFNITVGPPSELAFVEAPSGNQSASNTATIGAYQVQEQDAFGNPVPATSAITVNLSTSSAGTVGYTPFFSLSTGGASGTAVTSVTIVTGNSTTAQIYYSDTSAGVPTLTASSSGLYPATAITTISPAAASKLVYMTNPPATVEVGTKFSVVIAEEDAYGNTETGDSATLVSLSISGGFSCTSTPLHVTTGVATYTGCSYTTADGSAYTLTASSSSSPKLTVATASIMVLGTPSKLVYTTSPPTSTTAGTTFSVVVAEEDAYSNTETTDSSTALSLTASNGSGNGGFSCATTPADVTNGIATYTGCSYTVASGNAYTLTAASSGLTSATVKTTVSPASANKLVFTTSPPASAAVFSTFSVVVAEEDAYGNTETTDSSTALSLTASSSSGNGGFSCATTPAGVTNGIATYTGCSYAVPNGTAYTLTASSSGLTSATATTLVSKATQTISFTSTAPSGKIYSGSNNQTYTVTATGGASGNAVTFTIDSSSTSGCTITGSTVSYGTGVGTCVIDANQAGNTDYAAATQVQQTFSVGFTPSLLEIESKSGGTVGVIQAGDHMGVTFPVAITAASVCPGKSASFSITGTVTINSNAAPGTGNDELVFSPNAGQCTGNVTGFASGGTGSYAGYVDLGSKTFVSSTATIAGSTLTFDSTTNNIQILFGTTVSGGVPLGTVTTATGTYYPDSAIQSNGISVSGSVTAADIFTVTQPTGSAIASAPNPRDGTADTGDQIIYTYSEQMDPNSILSGWNGSSTTVTGCFSRQSGSSTVLTIETSAACTTATNLGTVNLGDPSSNRYISAGTTTTASATMVMTTSGGKSVVTVTLTANPTPTGSFATYTGSTIWTWTPSASASDLAGNGVSTTTTPTSTSAENF